MRQIQRYELEKYKMVLQPTNTIQQFPKTLRFYYQTKDYRYYTFNQPVANMGLFHTEISPDSNLYHKDYNRKLTGQLTPEQLFMIEKIKTNTKGVVHMGTGKWKSRVIYAATCMLWRTALILTHNIKTAKDMYKWIIEHTNIPEEMVWLICTGSKHPQTGVVDIMTHASFKKSRKEIAKNYKYNTIFYDECDYHLSFPKGYDYDCMIGALIFNEQERLYWLTGTPYRADWGKEALERVFGDIRTYEDSWSWSLWTNIKEDFEKYYYTPTITQIEYYTDEEYIIENRQELVKELVDDRRRLSAQTEFIENHSRKRNLVLVKSVQESYNLFYELESKLDNVVLMNGDLSQTQDRSNNESIQECIDNWTGITIIGTIDKIWRWVDIPPIDTLFLFSPVKFKGTVVQAVWRALRKYPWKTDVRIYDRCDVPILRKQKRERAQAYYNEYWVRPTSIEINETF